MFSESIYPAEKTPAKPATVAKTVQSSLLKQPAESESLWMRFYFHLLIVWFIQSSSSQRMPWQASPSRTACSSHPSVGENIQRFLARSHTPIQKLEDRARPSAPRRRPWNTWRAFQDRFQPVPSSIKAFSRSNLAILATFWHWCMCLFVFSITAAGLYLFCLFYW